MEQEVEVGLYNALIANGTISGITTQIHPDVAPASATLPYLIISLNAGREINDNPAQKATDLNYLVKAVSTNIVQANTLATAIRSTLHEATLTLATWTNFRCQIVTPVRMVETIDREQYFHRGYIIRIRSND